MATATPKAPAKPAVRFTPYITLPNGTVIWAKHYGKKAFAIPIADNDDDPK